VFSGHKQKCHCPTAPTGVRAAQELTRDFSLNFWVVGDTMPVCTCGVQRAYCSYLAADTAMVEW